MYPYFSNKDEQIKKLDTVKENLNSDNYKDENMEEEDFRRYIIESVEEAIKDEERDTKYYQKMYNMVSDENDKSILRQIYLDEMKHKKIFMELYRILTGEEFVMGQIEDKEIEGSLKDELYNSIQSELEGAEFYRMLMSAFLDLPIRDMIYEPLMDEQKHALLVSNLYNKYK